MPSTISLMLRSARRVRLEARTTPMNLLVFGHLRVLCEILRVLCGKALSFYSGACSFGRLHHFIDMDRQYDAEGRALAQHRLDRDRPAL